MLVAGFIFVNPQAHWRSLNIASLGFHISSISYSSLLLISIFSMTFTKEIKLHHSPVTPQFTTEIHFHLKKGSWTKNCLKFIDKKAIKPGEKITGGSYFDDFIVFSDYYGNASFLILSVWFMILPPPATTTISAAAGQKRHAAAPAAAA